MSDTCRTDNRQPSFTKAGPGRKHKQGKGTRPHWRGFADTYLAARAATLAESKAHREQHPRDVHGMACTKHGHDMRSIWLGGISAQRGY